MRICFVVHQSTKEGAGRYMLDQVDQLLPRGFEVFAILPADGPLRAALVARNVEARIIPSPWWDRNHTGHSQPNYARTLVAARSIAAALREWKIDVVYTHTVVVLAGAIGATLAGIPHVWHIHEFSYNPTGLTMAIAKPELARLFALTSNRIYFSSKAIADEWEGSLPNTSSRLVYNWTSSRVSVEAPDLSDTAALDLLADEGVFVVAVVGSVHSWKRQADVIAAVGNLLRDGMNVALLVVGPEVQGNYVEEVKLLAAQQSRPERIRFCGYTEFPERIMRAADVCVVPSDKEPFGRVTIESMAQGTPVVGSDSGGTLEIVLDGINGLLYPTGNVAALTDTLGRLITDPELYRRLAAGALSDDRFTDAGASMAPVLADFRLLQGQPNPSSPLGVIVDRGIPDMLAALQKKVTAANLARKILRRLIASFRR